MICAAPAGGLLIPVLIQVTTIKQLLKMKYFILIVAFILSLCALAQFKEKPIKAKCIDKFITSSRYGAYVLNICYKDTAGNIHMHSDVNSDIYYNTQINNYYIIYY